MEYHPNIVAWGVAGFATPRFWDGGRWGRRGSWTGRVTLLYSSLSLTGSMFESGDFSREIEQFAQNVAVNGHFGGKTEI